APAGARGRPAAVRAAKRVDAILGGGATHALEAHVLHAVGTARDEHVAHDAVLADAERRAIDEEMKAAGVEHAELEQASGHRVRRWIELLLGGLRLQVLALPVALQAARAAAGERDHQEQSPQERSAASAERTSGASSAVARYSGWSEPTTTPAPLRSASRISRVSSKRRKCTEEVFSSVSRSRSSSAMA